MDATDPWRLGPHRISIMRKIGDEETVLIESYAPDASTGTNWLAQYLGVIREHRKTYNRTVVMAATRQLRLIERRIEERGQVLRDIEEKLATYDAAATGQLPAGVVSNGETPFAERE